MNYSEHRYRSRDGLSLYYRSYGAGDDVVVCLPGLTRNCKDFEDLATHLSQRHRVITPDFRGRGRSEWDPRRAHYRPPTYVQDTWQLLDGMGVDRAALVGTSLGGMVAMLMACQQPRRLRGVVLNDIGPEVPGDAVSRILEYVTRPRSAPSLEAAAAESQSNYGLAFPGVPDEFWIKHVGHAWRRVDSGRWEPDMDPAIGLALRDAHRLLGPLRWLRRTGLVKRIGGLPLDPWDAFGALTMPSLLVYGELSDVLSGTTVAKMRSVKPDLEVVPVANRGHAPLLDEPEALAAIEGFLRRLD